MGSASRLCGRRSFAICGRGALGACRPFGYGQLANHMSFLSQLRRRPCLWVTGRLVALGAVGLGWAALAGAARAQEPVRASVSRLLARRFEPPEEQGLFHFGPFQGTVSFGLGLNYTDNSSVSNQGSTYRLQLQERLDTDLLWQVTKVNQVTLRLGASLNQTLAGRGGDNYNFSLTPDSELSWLVGIGDFRFRFFERLAVIQDPTSDPTIADVFDLNRVRNDVGVAVDWDLNKLLVTLLVDDEYVNQSARTNNQNQTVQTSAFARNGDRNTIRGTLQAGLRLTPTITVGPQVSVSESSGSNTTEVDLIGPGAFLNVQLSRLSSFELEAGENFYTARPSSSQLSAASQFFLNRQQTSASGYYVRATLRATVNRYVSGDLQVIHDLDYANGLNATERTDYRGVATYRLNKRTNLNVTAFYTDGSVLGVLSQGDFTQYGIETGASVNLGRHLSLSLRYRYTRRSSQAAGFAFNFNGFRSDIAASNGSYSQNQVNLSMNYVF